MHPWDDGVWEKAQGCQSFTEEDRAPHPCAPRDRGPGAYMKEEIGEQKEGWNPREDKREEKSEVNIVK